MLHKTASCPDILSPVCLPNKTSVLFPNFLVLSLVSLLFSPKISQFLWKSKTSYLIHKYYSMFLADKDFFSAPLLDHLPIFVAPLPHLFYQSP